MCWASMRFGAGQRSMRNATASASQGSPPRIQAEADSGSMVKDAMTLLGALSSQALTHGL